MRDHRKAIRQGAALLDQKEPGWRDRIAPAELQMEDCDLCVLGQVFSEYERGLERLGYEATINTGAFATAGTEYPRLTREWVGFLKGEWS